MDNGSFVLTTDSLFMCLNNFCVASPLLSSPLQCCLQCIHRVDISDQRAEMFAQVARRALTSTRNFSTSVIRRGGDGLPPPGDNLPFSINNR